MTLEQRGIVLTIEEAKKALDSLVIMQPDSGLDIKRVAYGIKFPADTNRQNIQTICDTFKSRYKFYSIDGYVVFDIREKDKVIGYIVYLMRE